MLKLLRVQRLGSDAEKSLDVSRTGGASAAGGAADWSAAKRGLGDSGLGQRHSSLGSKQDLAARSTAMLRGSLPALTSGGTAPARGGSRKVFMANTWTPDRSLPLQPMLFDDRSQPVLRVPRRTTMQGSKSLPALF